VNFYKHQTSICESEKIGENTRLWAFTHVLPGAQIGKDCNICDQVFIENDVVVGDRVTIKSGVQLWDGIRISDDVFVGPNVTFTNDKFPRSKNYPEKFPTTTVNRGASIGANATILPGIDLGEGCMIGAGSVVTKSVPPFAIVYGNPARIQGYVEREFSASTLSASKYNRKESALPGASKFIELKCASDARGSLTAIDFSDFSAFEVKRIFYVYDVPTHNVRGEHAHKTCIQFLIALHGTVKVLLDDGNERSEVILDRSTEGLLIPPMVWGVQFQFSEGAVLSVLASEPYDEADYIRSYADFKSLI
jgi:acetyltransferase-like isoleucine patch superfamily enzyme/dTDP-4-dehydrorhamnose 3,5-epimerase-like enzyme